MKTFKLLVPALVFIIAVMGSAFTVKHEKPIQQAPTSALYWYVVSFDQNGDPYIASSSDFVTQDEKANVTSPCEIGNHLDCLQGFQSQLTNFPSTMQPNDRIKRP